jgi:hypothetical protein
MAGADGASGATKPPIRWRVWALAITVPALLFIFTQLEFVQNARGHLIRGLPWDIGKWDILADIVAPVWVVSIVVLAVLERRLLDRYPGTDAYSPRTWFGRRFATEQWVRRATVLATAGAVLIVVLSWAREWVRFGELPSAFWYVLAIVATMVLIAIPLWWLRHDLHAATQDYLNASPTAAKIDAYLFDDADGPPRWTQAVVFIGLIALGTFVVINQLEGLLRGMHPAGEPSAGLNSLPSLFDLDLSAKRDFVAERVQAWSGYGDLVGAAFASAFGVAVLSVLIDSLVLIPAYTVLIGILLLKARRSPTEDLAEPNLRTYELLIVSALGVLFVTAAADLVENAITWRAIWRAWNNAATLDDWHVRVMWFASATKTLGFAIMAAAGVLILALRRQRFAGVFQSLVAVRGELLVLGFVSFGFLMLPQVADVIRRWDVSITLLTVGFAIALAMLLHYTSAQTLRGLRRDARSAAAGEELEPTTMSFPWSSKPVTLRRAVVASIFVVAALQVLLIGALELPVGLGFMIPAALITILWLFGIPLPSSPFDRGDRVIPDTTRRILPRMLGAAVFAVLGLAVIRAAVPELVFAKHGDWWLLFILIPISVGFYRLHTRSGPTMGDLEALIAIGVMLVGAWLIVVEGNPELSAVALTFTGTMLLFGSMAFFYSYEADSRPSQFVSTRLQFVRIQPLLAVGAIAAVVMGFALILFPLQVAVRIGTIAILLLGSMLFAAFAAAMVAFAERTRPPKILASFRVKRTPVFVFLLAWIMLASMAATGASNDVPILVDEAAGSDMTVTIDDVWERWLDRNTDGASPPGEGDERPAMPLVFIAASGGGIRAAVWTSYVLDCIFTGQVEALEGCPGGELPEEVSDRIAVMSGVSGGSLGLAAFSGLLVDGVPPATQDWVKARLDDDFLGAAMAWLLLVDTPRSFIGFGPRIRDRAEVMELTWERSWNDAGDFLSRGMFEVWQNEPALPLLVFNGTSVTDPCRFNVSVLDGNAHDPTDTCTSLDVFENTSSGVSPLASLAATQDLADFLCADQDIRISTGALMTARFPVVSPSGRIGEALTDCGEAPRVAYVVDGGYLEGSGAGTITELWDQLESRVAIHNADPTATMCVVPFVIQIDNGYENPGTGGSSASPREALIPITALLGSQFGRIANAREHLAIEFDLPFSSAGQQIRVVHGDGGDEISSRYARVVTQAHPGIQAPLGWTLSNASIDDLKDQLALDENQTELAEIERWLDGDLRCVTP